MSLITQSSIDRIKELPILDVVKHYVADLKKSGANYAAKSPWADEKTASFYVVPAKNIFKDFSTGKGGGVINFVMEFHGGRLSYPEVLKEIAEKCNERLEYEESHISAEEQKKEQDRTELLYKINEAASRKYLDQLREIITASTATDVLTQVIANVNKTGHPAFKELEKRKYNLDTIIQWQIGYAPGDSTEFKPKEWRFITDLVGDKNYEAALELGLIHSKSGHTYDTFRHRIMYPIHNHNGRILGFGGRTLAQEGNSDFKPAKYINSSDSAIYKKETVLFGLHFAAEAIRKCGYAYLMEGYTDVISFHQAGYACTVATCGTALTQAQCKLLARYTKKVVLFRDGDAAGEKAALRDIDLLLTHGFEVAVVPMPKFEDGRKVDPDDLTRLWYIEQVVQKTNNEILTHIDNLDKTIIADNAKPEGDVVFKGLEKRKLPKAKIIKAKKIVASNKIAKPKKKKS